MTRKTGVEVTVLVAILLGACLLRVQDLDQFKLTDETKWAFRSANFNLAVHRGDFSETFQRSHPGVTTMWAGWLGMQVALPDYSDNATRYVENPTYKDDLRANGVELFQILVPARYAVIAIVLIVLLIGYLYLRRLFGVLSALFGTLLLAFEPFFLGHTRILHVDGFLSSFMFLSVVAYLAFLQDKRGYDLVLSGVTAGLTLLTKTPGFYLIGGVFLISAVHWISQIRSAERDGIWKSVWNAGWPFAIWGAIAGLTFFAFWPAMWVQPIGIAKQLIRESIEYAVQGHTSPVVFNGVIYRDGIVPRSVWQYYPVSFLWRVSPIALAGLAMWAGAYVLRAKPLEDRAKRIMSLSLLLFAIGFMVFMSVGSKRSDRYVLPVLPAISILAGLGWGAMFEWLKSSSWQPIKNLALPVVILAMAVQVALPILYLPYYLSYFNPLMGGARKAPQVLQIGWGEGLDEAARYLNAMPGAEEMTVASWYERVFSEFFRGKTYNIEDHPTISTGEIEQILNSDYIVIYYHQFQRDMPENLLDILEDQDPIHTLWFNGLEYVRIYDPDTFRQVEG